jgi:arylsulfatase A-like enzyme
MKVFKIAINALFTLTFASAAFAGEQKQPSKPNIILILVDDMGWGDVGAFWQNQRNRRNDRSEPWQFTPNLDAMAERGAMLTNHYCAAPVCAPSRASILLGVSQGHANVRDNQFDKELQNTFTIGHVLQKAGYKTGLVGKWGLQGAAATEPEWPAHPLNRGFDYSYAYIKHVDGHEHYPKEGIYRGRKNVWENKTNVAGGLDKCFTTDLWTAAAKRWIREEAKTAKNDQPFFLYLAYDVPHAVLELPTQAYPAGGGLKGGLQWLGTPGKMINTASGDPDSYIHPDYARATYDDDKNPATAEKPWPDTYKRYATLCRRIDDGIGDIFRLLKDLKIDDNTMVVFTSDNGPSIESYLPKEYVNYSPEFFNSFGPFDGIKRDVWEGGVRVPTIVSWPGTIPGRQVIDSPSASHDWLATFADAAHIAAPARTDGVSLLPHLTGRGTKQESLIYIEYEQNGKTPDFEEFAPNHRSRQRNQMQKIRKGEYVGVRYRIESADDDFEIYQVVKDPQETQNLAPDPAFRQMQQDFKRMALRVRRPDPEAPRPYDQALIPPITTNGAEAGLKFKIYKGKYPWVSDLSNVSPAEEGMLTSLDLSKIKTDEGMLVIEGVIRVEKDGKYSISMSGNDGFLVKMHQANVLDGSFDYQKGRELAATVALEAGDHPIRIVYHIQKGVRPKLAFQWQPVGGAATGGPAFFHK